MTFNSGSSKNYPLVQLSNENELGENSSQKKQLDLVGRNKRVVDFGCATGYFSQLLKQRNCQVVGVEINAEAAKIAEQYCEQVIVVDLDLISIPDVFPDQKFEVVVFGDVLEHLRDPWRVLEEARRILQPNGYVVASIPNIAHGAVRLALLQGRFEYADLGILDNTHLRFFTRKTVQELFEQAGYEIDVMERTVIPPFSGSPLVPSVNRGSLSDELIQQIEQAEDADTLQFVLRAFPVSAEGKYCALELKYSSLEVKYSSIVEQNLQLQVESSNLQEELGKIKYYFQQAQVELQQTQGRLEEIQQGIALLQKQKVLMENSKFWKLRKAWFRLKRIFGSKEKTDQQMEE